MKIKIDGRSFIYPDSDIEWFDSLGNIKYRSVSKIIKSRPTKGDKMEPEDYNNFKKVESNGKVTWVIKNNHRKVEKANIKNFYGRKPPNALFRLYQTTDFVVDYIKTNAVVLGESKALGTAITNKIEVKKGVVKIKVGDKWFEYPEDQIESWDADGNIKWSSNINWEFLRGRPEKGDDFVYDKESFLEIEGYIQNLSYYKNYIEISDRDITNLIEKIDDEIKFEKNNKKKIAFLFLTIHNLKKGKLWFDFLNSGKDRCTLYSHPKYPEKIEQKFLLDAKIDNLIETKWGDISLVMAQNNMMKEALKDETNEYFILVSDSCIPLYDFDYIYNQVVKIDKSWISYHKENDNSRYKSISNFGVDISNFYKQSQFMLLKRKHVKFILKNDSYINNFNKSIIPDEHYYINIFKNFYKEFEKEFINHPITYVNVEKTNNRVHEENGWCCPTKHINVNKVISLKSESLFYRKVDYLTTIDFSDKINILLLPDVNGWAFDNISKAIVKYNPYTDKIKYDIKYIKDINNLNDINLYKYDYIYVFFEADRLIPDSKKVIRGCYSAFWLENSSFSPNKIAKYFERCNSAVFSNSFLKDSISEYLPEDYKSVIIPDSSDEGVFYPIEGLKKEKLTVIFVGNINRKIKNFDTIKWICEQANVELIVCSNINHTELVNFYNTSDVCINFSEFEGGPQTFTEAALCEVPMLIRNNNELGKIIPCFRGETKEEFVDILKNLKENRSLCREMGKKAREVVLDYFTYKITSKKFADFFLSLKEDVVENDFSDELTVFIISCGYNPNYENCKKSLDNQTIKFKIKEIKDVSPMSDAFQKMIDDCDTKYYIQVDEDMILYKDSIEVIYNSIKNSDLNISTVTHMLKDVHLDFNLYGIKVYKYDILKNYPYNLEIISCEVEQIKRLQNDGYQTLMVEKVLGYHSPKWTSDLIYERYFDLMEKWKNFKYNWLGELPSKLFQIFQKDPSDINFYALMGVMNSLSVKEPIRKREKNFTLVNEDFESVKKIVEYNNFKHIINIESKESKILGDN